MTNVSARVKEIIAEWSDMEPASLDDGISLSDIGTDSGVLVGMLKALETEYQTTITVNDAGKLPTIGDFIHCILRRNENA